MLRAEGLSLALVRAKSALAVAVSADVSVRACSPEVRLLC